MTTIFEEVTPSQAARILGLSRQRVLELERAGRIPCSWTPYGRLFKREDVHRLAEQRQRDRATRV